MGKRKLFFRAGIEILSGLRVGRAGRHAETQPHYADKNIPVFNRQLVEDHLFGPAHFWRHLTPIHHPQSHAELIGDCPVEFIDNRLHTLAFRSDIAGRGEKDAQFFVVFVFCHKS
ncbi:MAG: hypothetical protein ILNGONEN_01832 [Syntrophorhabdaceae bacterium]|nr:hypothetical protein [Syntrophorhabdaceae bacterium]